MQILLMTGVTETIRPPDRFKRIFIVSLFPRRVQQKAEEERQS